MFLRLNILILFTMLIGSILFAKENITIILKDSISVNKNSELRIKDLAELECSSAEKCNKIKDLRVEYNGDFVSKYNVLKALGSGKDIKILGKVTKILRKNSNILKERLTASIKTYVIAVCKNWQPDVTIDLLNFKDEGMEKDFQITASSFNCLSGNILFNINKNSYIFANVKIFGNAVKAIKDFSKDETINKGNVVLQRRIIDTPNLINNINEVIGLRSRCLIKANANINANCLEIKPLIASGDTVQLSVKADGVELTTSAKALQSGRLGELINLKNITTNKIIQARVISNDKAEVNL